MLWTTGLCLLWASSVLGAPVSKERQKLLLISFDGFRWDYDRDVDTPNLDQMAKDGVKAQYITPPYLTITSPSHFTLLTGRYIENHGVIHNMWFNTTTSAKKPYYQTQFVNEWWDNGSLPIWITAQRQVCPFNKVRQIRCVALESPFVVTRPLVRRDPYLLTWAQKERPALLCSDWGLKAGSLHFPGTASSYQGQVARLREVEPLLYNYKNETAWRENTDKVMGWFRDQDLDFVSLYFGEPDGVGHKFGPDSPERRDMVRQVDRTVGYIRQSAQRRGLSDRLNIIMTADHGMSTVFRNGMVDEIVLRKIPGFSFSDLSFHLVDYGPAGMLLPKPGKLEAVYQTLKGAHPHLHVYKKEEMPERLRYANNDRILPIVLWADPGYVINGYFPVQINKGEHGYDNQEMDMKPFFRAVGPAFHRNLEVGPFETVNVYPLMCHLLGIQPEANDGHLDATKHMLLMNVRTGERVNILRNVFTGFAAVAGFLLLVFIFTVSHKLLQRKRKNKSSRSESFKDAPEKETKQTSL